MSLFKKTILISIIILQGCGFRPMYYSGVSNSNVNEELRYINLKTIPDRLGVRLKNHLTHFLAPNGFLHPSKYELITLVTTRSKAKGFRVDSTSSAIETIIEIKFSLLKKETGKIVFKDSVFSAGSHSVSGSTEIAAVAAPIASETSLDEAVELAAKLMSERISGYILRKIEESNEN